MRNRPKPSYADQGAKQAVPFNSSYNEPCSSAYRVDSYGVEFAILILDFTGSS